MRLPDYLARETAEVLTDALDDPRTRADAALRLLKWLNMSHHDVIYADDARLLHRVLEVLGKHRPVEENLWSRVIGELATAARDKVEDR